MSVQPLRYASKLGSLALAKSSLYFDWAMLVLSLWFVGGLFVDGWAHTHNKVDQSFFTPWHAILYSGWAVTALFLVVTALVNHQRGATWRESVPAGYFPALIGAGLFGLGGLGDMVWHIAFGIERGVEALLSPTHLLLAVSMGLVASGPLRAVWQRPHSARVIDQMPMLLSVAFTLSVITFFVQSTHPVTQLWGLSLLHNYRDDDFAATALLLGMGVLTAAPLFVLRRGQPVPGAFTLIYGVNALAMAFLNSNLYPQKPVLAFVLAGAILDVIRLMVCPSPQRVWPWRLFAMSIPAVILGAYLASLLWMGGIGWRIHFWLGIIVMSSVAALIMSEAFSVIRGENHGTNDRNRHSTSIGADV